jgi:hypothetical protein
MAPPKRRKCISLDGKHQWQHMRNVVTKTQTLNTITLTERGFYRCTRCPLGKYGPALIGRGEAD